MRIRQIILSIFIIISFFSCEKDFDPVLPMAPVPVVYGLLDNSDTAHWIKLSKSFILNKGLTSQNISTDSLIFPGARVFLERWNGDYIFDRAELIPYDIPRDDGLFPSTPNPQFYLPKNDENFGLFSDPNPNDIVKLIVDIPGLPVVYSQAVPLRGMRVMNPRKGGESASFFGDKSFEIKWSADGAYHEMFLEFCYTDHYYDSVCQKSVSWKEFHSIPGYHHSPFSYYLTGPNLMIKIAANLDPDKTVRFRTFDKIKVHFYSCDNILYTYRLTNLVKSLDHSGIQYNNIVNGLGLFGARSKAETWFTLGYIELDSLSKGQYTKDLGFVNW